MKRFPSSRNPVSKKQLALALLAAILLIAPGIAAQNTPSPTPGDPSHMIRITSDRLVSDNTARFAEFIGNVRATQGTTIITADRLKVYYKSDMKRVESQGPGEESIQKLESTGHVVIHFDNRVAKAENAIYITDSRILILKGPNSSITSGTDTVTGEKITLYREDGRIQVESGKTGRVEAVFYQKGNVLN